MWASGWEICTFGPDRLRVEAELGLDAVGERFGIVGVEPKRLAAEGVLERAGRPARHEPPPVQDADGVAGLGLL